MIRFSIVSAVAVPALTAAAFTCYQPAAATAPDPITEWSLAASAAATAIGMAPLRTPITLALVHLAMYDAVNSILGEREPYAAAQPVVRPASAYAAAVEAGYRVLLAEFPMRQDALNSEDQTLRGTIPDGPAKENGAAVGVLAAKHLLALRVNDGRNDVPAHVPKSGPGVWLPTPSGISPGDDEIPRARDAVHQGQSVAVPADRADAHVAALDRGLQGGQAFGVKKNSSRSEEQTATGLFWEPFAGTEKPFHTEERRTFLHLLLIRGGDVRASVASEPRDRRVSVAGGLRCC